MSSSVVFQLPVNAGLLRQQLVHHQLLYQSHNPLLRLQEVQKVLQGKQASHAFVDDERRVAARSAGRETSLDIQTRCQCLNIDRTHF